MGRITPLILAALVLVGTVTIDGNVAPNAAWAQTKAVSQNRLSKETSSFLKSHAADPVDWYTWGPEAFAKAKQQNKPLLVSSGFSACHYSQLMQKESFANPATAALMNANFINVLIDREERPELDAWLAQSLEGMGISPGWPLTIFVTPAAQPFFGGAYFPPEEKYHLPAFKTVLTTVADRWKKHQPEVVSSAKDLAKRFNSDKFKVRPAMESDMGLLELDAALKSILAQIDFQFGDLKESRKHPHPALMQFLLAATTVPNVEPQTQKLTEIALSTTIDHYINGALRDHLDGGFFRFCVDARWNRPHFEKMLYDNAELASLLYDGYRRSGKQEWLQTAEETENFILNKFTGPEGEFYNSFSADQDGDEGTYYRFTSEDIAKVLGEQQAKDWAPALGMIKEPRGTSVHLMRPPKPTAAQLHISEADFRKQLATNFQKLREYRDSKNRHPAVRDSKILASSNALAISSLIKAYRATGNNKYLQQAIKSADYFSSHLTNGDKVKHSFVKGDNRQQPDYLDDYAYAIRAYLDLGSVDLSPRWVKQAQTLMTGMLKRFENPKTGRLMYSLVVPGEPVLPPLDVSADGLTPSPVAIAAIDMLRLGVITNNQSLWKRARKLIRADLAHALEAPQWNATMVYAGMMDANNGLELVLVTTPKDINDAAYKQLARSVFSAYVPFAVLALQDGQQKGSKPLVNGKPAAYLCTRNGCEPALLDAAAVEKRVGKH